MIARIFNRRRRPLSKTKRNSDRHLKTVCTHSGEGKSLLISVIKRTRAAVSSAPARRGAADSFALADVTCKTLSRNSPLFADKFATLPLNPLL